MKVCVRDGCDAPLTGKRRDARYCSDGCRHMVNNRARDISKYAPRVLERARERRRDDPVAARARDKAERDGLRNDILVAYGHRCACCAEDRREFLTIDHVNGGGRRDRVETGSPNKIYRRIKREGFPPSFRLLCWNCNCAIGMYGRCPHESESAVAA